MGKKWLNSEIENLIDLRNSGIKLREIGILLNRTEGSVQIMLRRLGKTNNLNWTDFEIKKAIELYNNGLNFKEISDYLNKTQSAVTKKLHRMGLKSNYKPEISFKHINKPKGFFYKKNDWLQIQKDYDSGLSHEEIRNKYKLSSNAIIWAKNNNKFISRTQSDSLKLAWKKNKFPKSNKKGIDRYRQLCEFKFSLNDYPDKFDFELIEKYGWYSASNRSNNINGVSRDHIYSIKNGFINNVDPKIMSHPANCRLILHRDNQKKKNKSNISLNELKEKIKHWDVSPHADNV